jgi:oligopeptide transport system substrate-binding protein
LKKLVYIILFFILALSLSITGCFIKPSSPTITETGSFPPAQGVLNLYSIDPFTLDPAVASEMSSHEYIAQIFSGLLQLGDNMEPVPDIAASMPDISSDGLTYTFHLRKNVTFHNGKSVTAADFKYSWERAASPATGSQTASNYLGDIVGVKEMLAGKATQISGVKVTDEYTIEVKINSPKSYFLYKMTYPTSFVVSKDNVSTGANWWNKPVGTGPFKFAQWTPNTSLTLDRNESYYGEIAKIKQVKYQFYTGLPMDLYETGAIDVTSVSTPYIDEVLDQSGPFYKDLSTSPELSFAYLGFNCTRPPFDDKNIRQAFTLAIDKDKIISILYKNMVQRADGILPPGIPGYNQNLTGLTYDVSKAQALIKSSKYGDVSKLPTITLTTSGYGGSVSSVQDALVYQWKQNLGMDVQIRQLEPERFYYNIQNEIDEIFDIGGWIADYSHPQDFIDILFHSNSENNYGGYSNSQVDNLIDQANRELDRTKSFSLYQQAEQLIVNDAACLPLTFGKNYLLVKPYIKGYSINPLGIASLEKVTILSH